MATQARDQLLHFRASSELATQANVRADGLKVSLSELIRCAIERELSATSPEALLSPHFPTLFDLAARGNHVAQSRLADHYAQDTTVTPDLATGLSIMWAGMASKSGNLRHLLSFVAAAMRRVEFLLPIPGGQAAIDDLCADALAVVEVCADAGHVPSGFVAVEIASRCSAGVLAVARDRKAAVYIHPLGPDESDADVDLGPMAAILGELERA